MNAGKRSGNFCRIPDCGYQVSAILFGCRIAHFNGPDAHDLNTVGMRDIE
jgi:hypothetical protein